MFVNLLPAKTRLQIQFRSILRRFVVIWGLAGVIALVQTALHLRQLAQCGQALAMLEEQCQPLYAMQQSIGNNQHELATVGSQSAILRGLQPKDHFINLLGVFVRATQSEQGHIYFQRLVVQVLGRPTDSVSDARESKTTAASAANVVVSLEGLADDDATLSRFVSSLRQADVFQRVDLKSSSRMASGTGSSRQYQLECRYEELP